LEVEQMKRNLLPINMAAIAVAGLALSPLLLSSVASGSTIVFSDSFSRDPAGTPVGTPPNRDTSAAAQAAAAASWVSSWGANNNVTGGYVSQTYTTYVDAAGNDFKVDGTNGISGNWLNNGSASFPLKLAGVSTTTTEPIGIPGFAWVQINHDFAADTTVTGAGALRINFDLYRTPAGNISWFFGNEQQNGQNNGNAGSPALNTANDIALLWRGGASASASYGVRDNGVLPPGVGDVVSYIGSPNVSQIPIPIQIDITGTNFSSGSMSTIDLTVAGVPQDLNGAAAGNGYVFTWDAGGAAYMGFGSNSTPVEGTVATPVYRASGIDNLVITAVPEPAAGILWLAGAGVAFRFRRRG
jgi:hypothetical protein